MGSALKTILLPRSVEVETSPLLLLYALDIALSTCGTQGRARMGRLAACKKSPVASSMPIPKDYHPYPRRPDEITDCISRTPSRRARPGINDQIKHYWPPNRRRIHYRIIMGARQCAKTSTVKRITKGHKKRAESSFAGHSVRLVARRTDRGA